MNPTAPRRSSLQADVRPREVWAWAMFDFANSGYTTVVITAVFNAYFVGVVAGGADWATFAWTAALSVSYAFIMLTAPLVGAYADAHAGKKKLLVLTATGCVLGTALLGLAGPGDLWLACALIVLSNFFFGTGENVVAAFLPELAKGEALGKVSAWGWSLGYIGGLITLAVCLAYVIWAEAHGHSAQQYVPVTMLITAAIFAVASLPTFLLLKERAVPQRNAQGSYVRAFARVGQTLRHARRYRDLARFLVCIVLYQAGVQTVIALAAIYAQEAMHFSTRDTLLLILVVNVTASLGALALRPGPGPARSPADDCADSGRLVLDGADSVGEHLACGVLGGRQSGRGVSGGQPVGRARAGRVLESGRPARRVLRSVGIGGEARFDPRPHHLWGGHLDERRRPSAGDAGDRQLLRARSAGAGRCGRRARTPCGPGGGTKLAIGSDSCRQGPDCHRLLKAIQQVM